MSGNHEPKRKPIGIYSCEGGYDGDQGRRPFKHASVGRTNWRRRATKKQRIKFKKAINEP